MCSGLQREYMTRPRSQESAARSDRIGNSPNRLPEKRLNAGGYCSRFGLNGGGRVKKKIDPTLFELCLGILIYGVVFELILLVFSRKAAYSIGLWVGVLLAVAGAVHMWWSLNRTLDMPEKDAAKYAVTNNIIRYLVVVIVMMVLIYTNFANPVFMFCGYMGMKISAYLNPVMQKVNAKIFKK